jgi:excisionase family DNA binding protein
MSKKTDWEQLPLTLSIKETAEVIGYGQARVRELCRANVLPHVRLGRAYRIPREALRNWLLQQSYAK